MSLVSCLNHWNISISWLYKTMLWTRSNTTMLIHYYVTANNGWSFFLLPYFCCFNTFLVYVLVRLPEVTVLCCSLKLHTNIFFYLFRLHYLFLVLEVVFHSQEYWGRLPFKIKIEVVFNLLKMRLSSIFKELRSSSI